LTAHDEFEAIAALHELTLEQELALALALARRMRELKLRKEDISSSLTEVNKEINDLEFKKLPDAMLSAGIRKLDVEADGNDPAMSVSLQDYIHAVIQAGWKEERWEAAFAKLEALGLGDLIRTEVLVSFGPGRHEEAKAFALSLNADREDEPVDVEVTKNVPWGTLTAAVKEIHRRGETLSEEDLQAIGAVVGKIAKAKEIRE